MAESITKEAGWYAKPTIDTITYFENLASSFYKDAKIMVDTKVVQLTWMDAKGQALNLIIPITQAAQGKKEWDEAIANGAGSAIQDLLVSALLSAGYIGLVAVATGVAVTAVTITAPIAAIIGGTALAITWASAYYNVGLGNIFEDAVRNSKKPYTVNQLLADQTLTKPLSQMEDLKMTDASGNSFSYSLKNQFAQVATNYEDSVWHGFLKGILENTTAQKLNKNGQPLDIRNLSPIELRNAVSHIDKVSFLLSEIKINVGEKLDMGSYGIYTVKSGDTLSEIAASHGMVTKDLVMLNTWLVDDGRIKFNYPTKVLIDAGTTISSGINHSMAGSGQDDVLIDHNGGNDTLVGYGGADYMDGGQGYDKYIAGNGDTIMDSDRLGVVLFEGTRLTKGIAQQGECSPDGDGTYKGDGGVYTLSNGTLTFKKNSGEILTIQKFVNGALGIVLTSENPGSSCPPPPPPASGLGTPTPNFSSPLVLDLNGDGVTSTFISDTTTYFDLDNDGVRQRTGWVQSDDALLVFDKNQDGKINNGTELFGNNTILKNGTKAANGFEALKEYDENKDGVIDAKDNIYNALQLWQDGNSDGVTDTGELHTLSELGVKSINLGYTQTTDYEEQNRIFQTSSFTMSRHSVPDTESEILNQVQDDEVHTINDVWFMTESRDTVKETIILKDTVAVLPDYKGAGRVANLSTEMNEIKIEREVA